MIWIFQSVFLSSLQDRQSCLCSINSVQAKIIESKRVAIQTIGWTRYRHWWPVIDHCFAEKPTKRQQLERMFQWCFERMSATDVWELIWCDHDIVWETVPENFFASSTETCVDRPTETCVVDRPRLLFPRQVGSDVRHHPIVEVLCDFPECPIEIGWFAQGCFRLCGLRKSSAKALTQHLQTKWLTIDELFLQSFFNPKTEISYQPQWQVRHDIKPSQSNPLNQTLSTKPHSDQSKNLTNFW
jgi:hypothetical protein